MDDDFKVIGIGMCLGMILGICVGMVFGESKQIQKNKELLSKLGIQIIETRVFNGDPVYSYRIIENKTKEESK